MKIFEVLNVGEIISTVFLLFLSFSYLFVKYDRYKFDKKHGKCKRVGHDWVPVYIKGTYNDAVIRFVACYCDRCKRGREDAHDINRIAINKKFGTRISSVYDKDLK